ncbi:uncharacterized protein LOC133195006 [Saccostrea echinata]|uniref:uncharacterized protein LOC133195006 n=1 Tax=Saccostrea echinata TaxID=191078 RepID=UPI002A823903|nr:uncharacterized protein LOC133195006 [Saccostrea echinata]
MILLICALFFLGAVSGLPSQCDLGMWRADPADCSKFWMCVVGKPAEFKCPSNTVVNHMMQACVPSGSYLDICSKKQPSMTEKKATTKTPLTPKPTTKKPLVNPYTEMCKYTPTALLPHPGSCAQHVDCSMVTKGVIGVFECPFPTLWNPETKQCDNALSVKCGTRWEPKDPCEYNSNICKQSAHCIPCEVRFPSCKGRPDGINAWSSRERTPYFVVCENERLVHQGQCTYDEETSHIIFDPVERVCVRL